MSTMIDTLIKLKPFNYDIEQRKIFFMVSLKEMSIHHYENCNKYKRFCLNNNFDPHSDSNSLEDYPYIPVNIFKNTELISVPRENLSTVLQSSATTSGIPSKVFVDKETSRRQTIASSSVMGNFLHPKRHDFFILDSNPSDILNSEMTARIAATRGFLILAKKYDYFMQVTDDGKLLLNV